LRPAGYSLKQLDSFAQDWSGEGRPEVMDL